MSFTPWIFAILFAGWSSQFVCAQSNYALNPQEFGERGQTIGGLDFWRFSPNLDQNGASPDLVDSDWPIVGSYLGKDSRERIDWKGAGWFRLNLAVPPELQGKRLAFSALHYGAMEIYLNGKLVKQFGQVGATEDLEHRDMSDQPFEFVLADRPQQLLAIKYSGFGGKLENTLPASKGFVFRIGLPFESLNTWWSRRQSLASYMYFFIGFFLVFFLFHGFLFIHRTDHVANLWVALISLVGLVVLAAIYIQMMGHSWMSDDVARAIQVLCTFTTFPLLLGYCYSAFNDPFPKYWWLWFGMIPFGFLLFGNGFLGLSNLLQVLALALVVWRVLIAIVRGKSGAKILGLGLALLTISVLMEVLGVSTYFRSLIFINIGLPFYGAFVLMILISFHNSREFANTYKQLDKELVRVKELSAENLRKEKQAREAEVAKKLLEADNERKTKELEEARVLQLSMLPKKIPQLIGFEIATSMVPATEVGGDYYDFYDTGNNQLIVAIGDATGHGTRAGTMVAAVKGLFSVLAQQSDLVTILKSINAGVKQLQAKNMFMALGLLRMEGNQIDYSLAGMPPLLVYRSKTKTVEQFGMRALPLGGIAGFPYASKTLALDPGDHLLLMSDGLPELFNQNQEMLGEPAIHEHFAKSGHLGSEELIQSLTQLGDTWRGEKEPDDDITFVAIKALNA